MNFIPRFVLMIATVSVMIPAFAMDAEPVEELLKALMQGSSRALEDPKILNAAIATADKLVQSKMVAIAQIGNLDRRNQAAEKLPYTMRILELLKKEKRMKDDAKIYENHLGQEWQSGQPFALHHGRWLGLEIERERQAQERDARREQEERVLWWQSDARKAHEQEEKRLREKAARDRIYARAAAAVREGNFEELLSVLQAYVFDPESLGTLLSDACEVGNQDITQLLIQASDNTPQKHVDSPRPDHRGARVERYEARPPQQSNSGANSNND